VSSSEWNISVDVDLTNPGQFFACCGLLELADRLWRGAEGWFDGSRFRIAGPPGCSLQALLARLAECSVGNTMTPNQTARLEKLSAMGKRDAGPGLEDEKKALESLRREAPIILRGPIAFRVDWFCDTLANGSRFKTWAGQQSVLEIARSMHGAIETVIAESVSTLWGSARGIGLPFNFDSDLGGQGSALDIGFSFDPLNASAATRIEGTCKPLLEFLGFVGLQRFRPREVGRQNRFVYVAWNHPLPPSIASAAVCGAIDSPNYRRYEFKLLYRTKYLKSFLPSIPFHGDRDERSAQV